MQCLVTIKGPPSSMKTPMARAIRSSIESQRPDLSCVVFDRGLFDMDEHYEDRLDESKEVVRNSGCDIGVIVITGSGSGLSVEVDPAWPYVSIIFCAVSGFFASRESCDLRSLQFDSDSEWS